jgi:predicted DNA-binding WGR domain protein
MALSTQEQKQLNKALEAYNKLQEQAIKNGRLGTNEQKEFIKNQETINKLTELQTNKSKQGYKDISKTLTDIGKKQRLANISGKDGLGLQKNVLDSLSKQVQNTKDLIAGGKEFNGLEEKLKDISSDITSGAYDLTGIKQTQLELDDEIAKTTDESIKKNLRGYKATLDAEAKRLKVNKGIENTVSTTDSLMGGMGSTIKNFITNPITAAVAALLQFGKTQEAIAGQFGAMGVTDFRQDLVKSQTEFIKLGMTAEDSNKAISELANNFGVAFDEADELSRSVARIAKTTGMSVEESTKLVGLFIQTQGLTGAQAENLLLSTRQLAKANNVAPDQVLKDVAANTELFAKFSADGGKNILEAAVQARKLGLGLDSVAKVADGLLNFQESLNAEITASVMIGRQLNLQKARELALNNDVKGAMEEVVKQVGSEAEFNKLNALERKALADAVGLEASELQKVVSASKEQKTLAGAISDATSKIEIPEQTMTAIASLIASFQNLGITLAESFGPTLNFVVGAFGMLIGGIDKFIGMGPALLGLLVAIKGQAIKTAIATKIKAIAGFFSAAAQGSLKTGGFGIPIMVGLATAAIAKMTGALSGVSVGDMFSPAKGVTQVSTREGGLFNLSPNDDFVAAPGIASAMAGGGASQVSAALENTINNLNQNIAAMRKDNESYFGFGGSVSSDIGTKVESKIVSNLK